MNSFHLIDEKKDVETWINEDPRIKGYLKQAKELYKGNINFIKSGKKSYIAKLDPNKLIGIKNTKEAYFELNLDKKKNRQYQNFFFLKLVDSNRDINTIKLF